MAAITVIGAMIILVTRHARGRDPGQATGVPAPSS
jgi:hypothetical protein